jgi:predicted phage terminase large subunit-like protein
MMEKARRDLHEFIVQAWHVLEPSAPLVEGIHVQAICEHLQAITEGRIRNLIINVPPGHAKSLLTAVFWPAWAWIDRPEIRWLFSSYNATLSVRDSLKCRRLIESDWYQERWGCRYQLTGDQNQKQRFENDRTGYRIATSVGGSATGERADIVVVDDPHSVDQAASDAERCTAVEWWNGTMSTRLNNFSKGHKVVIQQRLHEADLTGDLLSKGGYELLCLPAEFEPDRKCSTSIGWSDPRQEFGELLWPEKMTRQELDEVKITLGSYRYAGQYQQRPAPADGGLFKRFWWRYWRPKHLELPPVPVRLPDGEVCSILAVPLPDEFDEMLQSWDLAFKGLDTSDFVVGQVWGASQADRFLLDQHRDRMDMPKTVDAIRAMSGKWPEAARKLVEDKANGPAVIAALQHEIAGLIAVNPAGGKIARAQAISPQCESGNVYLPHPALAPWVEDFIEECAAFPNATHDDQVDAMTQALNRQFGGLICSVPESEITIPPFEIPDHWPRAFAIDVDLRTAAVIWGAWDRHNDTIYLYGEYFRRDAEPSVHAHSIRSRGTWIRGVMNAASRGRSQIDAWKLLARSSTSNRPAEIPAFA